MDTTTTDIIPDKGLLAAAAADAILAADSADETLTQATVNAAQALHSAAIAVHKARSAKVSLRDIAAARAGVSPKSAQRLEIVGLALVSAPDATAPEGAISLAHVLRATVVKAERMGVGIGVQRTAVDGASDPLGELLKLISAVGESRVIASTEGEGETVAEGEGETVAEGEGETVAEDEAIVFDSTADTAAATALVEQATAAVVALTRLLQSERGVRADDRPAVDALILAVRSMGEAGVALALVGDCATTAA